MHITPPYGYREIVPFMQDQRVSRLPDGTIPDFVHNTNSLPISLSEVSEACHDYPLVFVPQQDSASYALVAILGMADKENLFIADGKWREGTYVPAYVRRYPFCITRVTLEGVQQSQRLVCVEKDFISPDGLSMFDAPGQQTPQWTRFLEFMNQYETDMESTFKFCNTMRDFKLLEPMTLEATVNNRNMTVGGMYRISFARMNTLNSSEIKTLYRNGNLGTIYHHISSLTRFQRIFEMKSRLVAKQSELEAGTPKNEPATESAS
jgi:hypothetical protein